MTIVEVCLVIIAVAAVAFCVAAVAAVLRLMPSLQRVDDLVRDANQAVVRINRVAEETEMVVRDARRLEARVSSTVGGLLDKVEPPLRSFGALAMAVRAGAAALVNARRGSR